MRLLRAAAAVLLVAGSAGIGFGKVVAHAAKERSVYQHRTYSWEKVRVVRGNDVIDEDPLIAPLVREAVNKELQARGFTEVAEGGEMTVITAALATKSAQLEGFLMMWGMDWWWGYYPTAVQTVQREHVRGVLFVNLIVTQSEEPLWGGYVTEALPRKGSEGRTVNKAAGKLFKKFPKNRLR